MAYKKTGDAGNGGGSAPSDFDDFIFSKWLPFAQDQGYVANRAPSPGSAPNRELWTHRGSVGSPEPPFVFIRTLTDGGFLFTGLGVNLSEEIYDQPDNPANAPATTGFVLPTATMGAHRSPVVTRAAGPYASHWLFSNAAGDYIHAVIRVNAKRFRHFWYGKIPDANKYGSWVGGEYVFGMHRRYDNNDVMLPNDGDHAGIGAWQSDNTSSGLWKTGGIHCEGLSGALKWWFVVNASDNATPTTVNKPVGGVNNSGYQMGAAFTHGLSSEFGGTMMKVGASLIARTTALVPIAVSAKFDFGGNVGRGFLGTLPDVFYINVREFAAGEEITIGSDTYVVFPLTSNDFVTTTAGDDYSGYYGIAYKVIP